MTTAQTILQLNNVESAYGPIKAIRGVRLKVRRGEKVKRGDLIGYVGNTGLSAGPHLHYEVHKNGVPIDPANFFFNDLTPEEYVRMLELSRNANQSLE